MTDRIETAKAFLTSGKSVCPYSKTYANQTGITLVPVGYKLHGIQYPILGFAKGDGMAAAYVFESDSVSHAEERNRCVRLFTDLFKILLLDEHGLGGSSLFGQLERELEMAFSPTSRLNPLLKYKESGFFSIALNNLYGEGHPRWSPVPMVVVTRMSDVDAVPDNLKAVIRRESERRMGGEYDGVELYILPA
ncbi:MAG TPA: hypothetical protein VI968_04230 [archaeon]|nr:hypothetical protein [archaeon]